MKTLMLIIMLSTVGSRFSAPTMVVTSQVVTAKECETAARNMAPMSQQPMNAIVSCISMEQVTPPTTN